MALALILLVVYWHLGPGCSVSSPEWFSNITTDLFSLPGDIMLGGLFPINKQPNNLSFLNEPDNIKCESLNEFALGLVLVMKYAVDEINGNQSLLPGVKLGYDIHDTCGVSSVVVKATFSFLTAKSSDALSVECNYTDYETSMSAVIGPLTSEMVSVIGKLLGFFLIPQISYGATSDKFSDKLVYPSFFRTVPSDKWQVDAMARLMQRFSWSWVAVVGSEEEYGQQGVQQFSKLAEKMNICVAYQGLIPVYTNPTSAVTTIINNIIATEAKVVIVFALTDPTVLFFQQVIRRNVTGVWIASTSWASHQRVASLPNIHTIGTIIGFIDKTDTLDLLTSYTEKLFTKMSKERANMSPAPLKPGNPNNPCPQCWNLSPDNISLVTDLAVQRSAFSVYAAVYSAAHALHNLLECNSVACKWESNTKIYPWKLLEVFKTTSFDINGNKLQFDENGNPNMGYSLIQWIWKSSSFEFRNVGNYQPQNLSVDQSLIKWHTGDTEVPKSTCSAACGTGQVRRVKGFQSCCFDCIDCLPGTYQANEEDIQCTMCPERQWSLYRSTNCTDPVYDVLAWDTPEALQMILVGIVMLLCQGSVGVIFLMHRGTPLVMASGGALSFVALLSLMGACLSLLLFLGQPGDTVCHLQLPLISIFQTLPLSIIMSISLQVFFVSEFPETAVSHLHTLRGPGSWLLVLICCVVQAGLCGWFVQEGPSLSEHIQNVKVNFVRSFLTCPISSTKLALMQGLNGAMALVSFMCTFMAVKPLHQYNLARDITFSTLIYCVIWVIFIPVYTGISASVFTGSKDMSIVHVYFGLAGNLGLVVAYYFPKCYLLLRRPDFNTPEHFCTFLEGVPPTAAEEEPQPEPQPEK
ncbi:taste receptor type 1 member 3 [Melanotaenia boesemani]|uniref:taste receptor type 1 member 3 n=1 Tax=Melanotaenia boesemani TaxID=1250792 RepID=UPI001C03EEE7|nr:taste receptor type 1 member 3 [Melanotaenia boesemani]